MFVCFLGGGVRVTKRGLDGSNPASLGGYSIRFASAKRILPTASLSVTPQRPAPIVGYAFLQGTSWVSCCRFPILFRDLLLRQFAKRQGKQMLLKRTMGEWEINP